MIIFYKIPDTDSLEITVQSQGLLICQDVIKTVWSLSNTHFD